MRLLRTLRAGLVLTRVGILRTEVVQDELLGRAERQGGKVRGIGTHVGNQTALVEPLRQAHRQAHGVAQLAGRLLLERGGRKRRRREADRVLLLHGCDRVSSAYAVLQEGTGLLQILETGVQQAFDLDPVHDELGFHLIIWRMLESDDLFLAVHDEPERDGLHAAGRQAPLDFAPQDRGELEAHQPVQHAARLLRLHEVVVDVARRLDGMQDGVFGDFVENDAPGAAAVQAQGLDQVPGNGLSLTVLIRSQPDQRGFVRRLLQLGHHLLLGGGHDILGLEAVGDIHAELLVLQVPDVSKAGFDREFLAQIFLNGLRLGRRLDDN